MRPALHHPANGVGGKRLETDPRLREELDYCVPNAIPHSVFLGRVVGPGDPMWLEDDQDKALEWLRREKQKCPGCRTTREEWQRDPTAYIGAHEICPFCEVLEQERDNVDDDAKGVRVYLRPNPKDPVTGEPLLRIAEREAAEREAAQQRGG